MKRFVFMALAAFLLANAAHAAGFFVSGYLEAPLGYAHGGSDNVVEDDAGFLDRLSIKAKAGYAFDIGLRIEATVFTAELFDSEVFSDAPYFSFSIGEVNVLYDIITWKGLTPYAGGGLSISWTSMVDPLDHIGFTVRGVLGARYALNSRFSLDMRYTPSFNFNNKVARTIEESYWVLRNVFSLGVVYQFGVKD